MLRKNMPAAKAARQLKALELHKKDSETYINTEKNLKSIPNPREVKTKKRRGTG